MNNLENIKFQKLNTSKFTEQEKNELLAELKKRGVSCRLTTFSIMFDERYLKNVKDLIPASKR